MYHLAVDISIDILYQVFMGFACSEFPGEVKASLEHDHSVKATGHQAETHNMLSTVLRISTNKQYKDRIDCLVLVRVGV